MASRPPQDLLAASEPIDLEELTDWIDRKVFETRLDDPFLGLGPDDVYGALPAPRMGNGER